jgi:hypothetical protein
VNRRDEKSPASDDRRCACHFSDREKENAEIAEIIALHGYPAISKTLAVIEMMSDSHTAFYDRQNPQHVNFDDSYPPPLDKKSARSSREYWTKEVIRWRIRKAARSGGKDS